jgi:hypothetical protein
MYVGVPERTMAMAAAERPEWRPMSSGECPRIVGPISAAFRRSLVSAVALDNWKMLSPDWYVLIVLSGVVLGMPSTRLAIAAAWVTGHAIGSLVRLMVIVSDFSPFFWSWKVTQTMSARWMLSRSEVMSTLLRKKRRSRIRSSFVFRGPVTLRYSHDRRAKKNAMIRSGPKQQSTGVPRSKKMRMMKSRVRARWHLGDGSSLR